MPPLPDQLRRFSDFLPRLLARRPRLERWIEGSRTLDKEKPLEVYVREAAAAVRRVPSGDTDALYRRLRRYKYRELLRIAVRDGIRNAPMAEIGRECSHLAEGVVRAALSSVLTPLLARYGPPAGTSAESSGFCVLGLGKLGGEDLNFSSDIDLVCFYREEGETPNGTSHAQFYTRLAEALTRAVSTTTADGFGYRVDLNLRPQGRAGALVMSLPQMLSYYEQFGRTWERSALIKARPIAGDLELGNELLDSLSPFIWRRSTDLSAVDDLRDMRSQIDLRGKASADDVKLGRGGIREIEFFVSALQLLHGGKQDSLRERTTMKALRKLEKAGLVATTDADSLEEAYLFLRRVENRLQMVDERQTQTLPSSGEERERLGQSLGFAGWSELGERLKKHREYVASAFHQLLGQTARDEVPDEPLLALALDLDSPEEKRHAALKARGFDDPVHAFQAIERLSRIPESPFAATASGGGMQAVKLLSEVARTADPDQALHHLADFIGGLRAPQGYIDFLIRTPQATRRLLNLFGQSDYLSQSFLRHPELLDAMVQLGPEGSHKEPQRIREELQQRVTRYSDPEERLSVMRRYRNEEVLRIGLGDIGGDLDVPEVAAQLSAIADGALDETLFLAESELRARYGEPRSGKNVEALSIIGMGKLGGSELGYHSDLDLIFVYSGQGDAETAGGERSPITHHEYFAKLVQRLISFLQMQMREGYLYKVDTRLRPSGNKGPLVVSLEAFREHHEKRAQLWERQALLKSRGVAGDPELFERIQRDVLVPLVFERPLPEDAGAEIDRIRMRMEKEIGQETSSQVNPKTGHGGLVDVEFTAQYLQLVHGGSHPKVRTPNTLQAIEALQREGCLDAASAAVLRDGYLFHRRVENRLRLIHGQPISHLPTSGRPLELLARRLGYRGEAPGDAFLHDYRTFTARVRDVYARALRRA